MNFTHPADRIIDGLGGWDPLSGKPVVNNHKVGNNLWLSCDPGDRLLQVRLHETVIVEYQLEDNGWMLILDNGGFRTKTTLNRMNAHLPNDYKVVGSTKVPSTPWFLVKGKDHIGSFHGEVLTLELPEGDWPNFAFEKSSTGNTVGPTL